jgi:uncharacterized repeat protein (TIGR01451 family)
MEGTEMTITNERTPARTGLTILAALGLLFSTLAMVTPVFADGNDSSAECIAMAINADAEDADQSGDEVTIDAGDGNVVTEICIKSGSDAFGDKQHSGLITADGEYGDGCYTVEGLGTQTVTVTKTDSNDCKDISHVDASSGAAPTDAPTPTPTDAPTPTPTDAPTPTPGGSQPDTEIEKEASVTSIVAGGSYDYTLTVTNDDDDTALNVVAKDNLDNELVINSVSSSQGTCEPVAAGNRVTCNLGDMAGNTMATITINVTAPAAACGIVDNIATVQAENELNDDQTPEISDSDEVEVEVICEDESPSEVPSESPSASPSPSPSESESATETETASPSPSATGSVAPNEGQAGGNPTPGGELPDTATNTTSVPTWPFAVMFMASLAGLVYLRLATEKAR